MPPIQPARRKEAGHSADQILSTQHCGLANTARSRISIPSAHILHWAWQRGRLGSGQVVVVVANFSDLSTPPGPSPEYVVHDWPADPSGPEMAEDQIYTLT
jgi:hypothetical protein